MKPHKPCSHVCVLRRIINWLRFVFTFWQFVKKKKAENAWCHLLHLTLFPSPAAGARGWPTQARNAWTETFAWFASGVHIVHPLSFLISRNGHHGHVWFSRSPGLHFRGSTTLACSPATSISGFYLFMYFSWRHSLIWQNLGCFLCILIAPKSSFLL